MTLVFTLQFERLARMRLAFPNSMKLAGELLNSRPDTKPGTFSPRRLCSRGYKVQALSNGILVLASLLLATSAFADVTYTYNGHAFDYFDLNFAVVCPAPPVYASCPPVGSVSGHFTVATPLAANLPLTGITATEYSFTDGLHTVDSTQPTNLFMLAVSTDATGAITSWDGSFSREVGGVVDLLNLYSASPYIYATTYYSDGTSEYDAGTYSPGSWTGGAPPPPSVLKITSALFVAIVSTGDTYTSPNLTASGGIPPYSWAGFGLPNELNVSQVGDTGVISGIPLTPSDTLPAPNGIDIPIGSSGTIEVSDSAGTIATQGVNISVIGRPRYNNLSGSDKAHFLARAIAETTYVGALGFFGFQPECLAIPECSEVILAQITGVGQKAYYDYANAADPPDPNYTQVFQPIYDAVVPLTTGQGFTVEAANALNNLSQNQRSAKGLTLAIAVSLNRLQGAQQANDSNWAALQSQAAKWYALQLTSDLAAEPDLRSLVGSQVLGVLPNLQITPDQLSQLQIQVASNGFSPGELNVLSGAGLLSSEINIIANLFGKNQVGSGGGTLYSLVSGQTLTSSTQSALSSYGHLGADRNNDLQVTCADIALVEATFRNRRGQSGYDPMADVNMDGVVNIRDVALVSRQLPVNIPCQ